MSNAAHQAARVIRAEDPHFVSPKTARRYAKALDRADLLTDAEWVPGRWWSVIAPDGSLWCETSDEEEARRETREGDTLYRQFTRTESKGVRQ